MVSASPRCHFTATPHFDQEHHIQTTCSQILTTAHLEEEHDLLLQQAKVSVLLEEALAVLSGRGARHDVPAHPVPVTEYTASQYVGNHYINALSICLKRIRILAHEPSKQNICTAYKRVAQNAH